MKPLPHAPSELRQAPELQPAPELDQLAGLAAEVDQLAAPPAGAEREPPPPPVDHVAEARALVDMTAALGSMLWPSLEKVWTDPTRAKLAEAAGPLLAKYSITAGSLFAEWEAEIRFALVAVPVLIAMAPDALFDVVPVPK